MNTKSTTFCLLLILFSIAVQAQLRLNVQGNAAIAGNLNLGAPESNISGLDQLGGFNDLRFSADNGSTDHMRLSNLGYLGIGTIDPLFKLHVTGETQTVLGLENTSTGGRTYSIYSLGADNGEGAGNFMIRDETSGNNRFFIDQNGNTGIGTIVPGLEKLFVVADGNSSRAIRAQNNNSSGPEQIAIWGDLSSGGEGTRIGVFGQIAGDGGTGQHYGVYGNVGETNTSNITIGVIGTNSSTGTGTYYAGYFGGDVTVTGTFTNPSDEKLKREIKGLEKATERIMALHPISYQFREREYPQMQLPNGPQLGFIAQEVEAVLPELITDNKHPKLAKAWDEEGNPTEYYPSVDFKGVNYLGLIPVLTKATQEQQEEILNLRAENEALKDRLARLERIVAQLADGNGNVQTVPISDGALQQNQPNPFTETTTIHYAIPTNTQRAELRISDVSGRVLKSIVIDQRGEGQTRLEAQSLSPGTYVYSLVLDGRILETKKMILTGN